MKPRQSILSFQISFVLLTLVIILIFSILTIRHSLNDYLKAKKNLQINEIVNSLFQAVRHFGFERGRVNVVLNFKGNSAVRRSDIEFYQKNRKLGEEQLAEVLLVLKKNTISFNQALLENLLKHREKIQKLRKIADQNVQLPYGKRDPEFAQKWFEAKSQYIHMISRLSASLINGIGNMHAFPFQLLQMQHNLVNLRDHAGPVCSYLAAALLTPEMFSQKRKAEIISRNMACHVYFECIQNIFHKVNDTAIKNQIQKLEKIYFIRFKNTIDNALYYLQGKKNRVVSQKEFTKEAVKALEEIAVLMHLTTEYSKKYFTDKVNESFMQVLANIVILLFGFILLFYSLRNVYKLIYQPLLTLSDTMRQISGDQTQDVTIPDFERNDEIGDFQKLLEDFKQKKISLQQEKEKQEMLLIKQSKLADMGMMISLIAHQWKQPLNAISLSTDILELSIERPSEDVHTSIKTIKQHLNYMVETLNDYQNFYNPTRKVENFSVMHAIEDVSKLISSQSEKYGITIQIDGNPGLHYNGIQNDLKQIIMNLVGNAIDALVQGNVPHGHIFIQVSELPGFIQITVQDNAGGIPDKFLPDKIFNPFFTTKKEKGTGIGLSISKTILEKSMHGSLTAENHDNGALFTIKIPTTPNE